MASEAKNERRDSDTEDEKPTAPHIYLGTAPQAFPLARPQFPFYNT